MTTVYLVTDGCYSDYHVLGIYSTKEKAEEAKVLYMADNEIEEFALDAIPVTPPGMLRYGVHMNRDGDTSDVWRNSCEVGQGEREWYKGYNGLATFHVWATDEQHAVKIANERRAELIASGEW